MTPEAYDKIGALAQRLGAKLESVFAEVGVETQVTVVGSLFRVHFLPRAPRNYREAAQDDKLLQDYLFFWLLNHGIHWTSGGNISLPDDGGTYRQIGVRGSDCVPTVLSHNNKGSVHVKRKRNTQKETEFSRKNSVSLCITNVDSFLFLDDH